MAAAAWPPPVEKLTAEVRVLAAQEIGHIIIVECGQSGHLQTKRFSILPWTAIKTVTASKFFSAYLQRESWRSLSHPAILQDAISVRHKIANVNGINAHLAVY